MNKKVLITGGNSGIGIAAAQRFINEGWDVAIAGRNAHKLEEAQKQLDGKVATFLADATDLIRTKAMLEAVGKEWGKLDALVLNAGGASMLPFNAVDENTFDYITDLNYKSPFFTIQYALPYLNDGASIIFTTSIANVKGMEGLAVYSAAKAAVRSLTRSLAAELKERDIRVNSVSPGPIDTPIFGKMGLPEEQIDGAKQQFGSMVPLGRLGLPEEVAGAIYYLSSPEASYITGTELAVDGGMSQL